MDVGRPFCLEKSVASLRVFGDDLDPDEITRLLRKTPHFAKRRGDVTTAADGSSRTAHVGSWRIRAEKVSSGGLDAQIKSLLDDTPSDPILWEELNRKYTVDLFCGLFLTGSNQGLEIDPRTLGLLSDRGIKLGLDIYDSAFASLSQSSAGSDSK